ncbi:MAG: hypothetical protein ACK4GL_07665 [Flavobacteriales bacterium]
MRISIRNGAANGSVVYQKTQNAVTNLFGLFTLKIGEGTVVEGNFAHIPWTNGNQWVTVELDLQGNGNFVNIGDTQLLSVPYALNAQSSGGSGTQEPPGPAGLQRIPGHAGPGSPEQDGTGNLDYLNSFIDVFHRPSSAAVTQGAPGGGTIVYIPLAEMSQSIKVPAGKTYKVMLAANGAAFNLGAFTDCLAQYQFFINGAAVGASQRVSITDGLGGNLFQVGALSFYYGQWSISHAAELIGGQTYTIDVRGANAGPNGNGSNIQLASAPGFVGEAELNIVVFK